LPARYSPSSSECRQRHFIRSLHTTTSLDLPATHILCLCCSLRKIEAPSNTDSAELPESRRCDRITCQAGLERKKKQDWHLSVQERTVARSRIHTLFRLALIRHRTHTSRRTHHHYHHCCIIVMAPITRPDYKLNLEGLPQLNMAGSRSANGSTANSPIEPAGSGLRYPLGNGIGPSSAQLGSGRAGAGSPSKEYGSRLFPKR
jgi:hypothetical protein